MSKTTKRKHVTREVLDDFVLPEENQQIVKICAGRGNNLHEVVTAKQDKFLVSMPKKFRKNVWIKRGDYVIVEPIAEGDKVKAEIVRILYPQQVKYIQKEGKWPEEFTKKAVETEANLLRQQQQKECSDDEEDDDDDSDLFINTNHPVVSYYTDSSSGEDDLEEDDNDDDDGGDDESR
ncbi:probable RNA-binding protein EIF1AD [Anneissia japonica]|uniref:probable RNA-binding protein EIF1AD n=1 Tax=Anneissia japonica TaxID=1529436 RepID=UPI0014257EA4|nr:probable RNA-binding protein EIF1AD [Anneissia japonica]